jgi:tyrosinase
MMKAVPIRREIRDLQTNSPDQWNLFLLGMDAFQKVKENDVLSYYQIAGIHGMPYKPWDGVQGIPDFPDGLGGYCTHSSILFAPWHRPFLALLEMTLYNIVQDLSKEFPQALQAKYISAAEDFRLPYWDWASQLGPDFPTSISSPQVTVVDTDGATKKIPNPLYQFTFRPLNPSPGDFDQDWSQFPSTLRYPKSTTQSQDNLVTRAMANDSSSLRSNVSLILLSPSYQEFDAFSNNMWLQNGQPGSFGSLEDIHNEIHDKTGGPSGHMGSLDVSAFDPVFWLHHSNVDRIWAMWQDLNPDSYVTPKPSEGNFFTETNAIEDTNSALKPFWDADGSDFWIPTNVKKTTMFGYAYPETQTWNYSSQPQYQAALRQAIAQEYGGNTLTNFLRRAVVVPQKAPAVSTQAAVAPKPGVAGPPSESAAAHAVPSTAITQAAGAQAAHAQLTSPQVLLAQTPPLTNTSHVSAHVGSAVTTHNPGPPANPEVHPQIASLVAAKSYREWITNVRVIKHSLGQTFRVMVFLGDFNPDPQTWPFEPSLAGRVTVLGRGKTNKTCDKCQIDAARDLVVTGTVPLTSALLEHISSGQLASLEPNDVVPYLQKNLHWRVSLFDGSEQPRDQVVGLKVGICSTVVHIDERNLPVYSNNYDIHLDVTDGRPAGYSPGDQI